MKICTKIWIKVNPSRGISKCKYLETRISLVCLGNKAGVCGRVILGLLQDIKSESCKGGHGLHYIGPYRAW